MLQTTSGITDIAHSIQLAVAPVFLLSGVGVTLTVLTNRLARIIDRARLLESNLESVAESSASAIHAELKQLSKRARFVQHAITLSTACALLISLVIIALFASVALDKDLTRLIVILFIAALTAFSVALIWFLLEIRIGTASLRFGPGPH